MTSEQIDQLQRRIKSLEEENSRLKSAPSQGSQLDLSAERYRTLFDSIDEGFCIIEFLDGPHGPLSDYIHIEANAAYAHHAGIPNVVGQKVRDMVPDEADAWVELYRGVLQTGEPIRFERELIATGRYLALSAFRIEPQSLRQVAVLFQDVTARKRAENALQKLNETLEARVAHTLAERKVLADIVEATNAFVQVLDNDYRWIALNSAAAQEFEQLFGVRPTVGDNLLALLERFPEQQTAARALWQRAFSGESFMEVADFGEQAKRKFYEMRFNPLHDANGQRIGAYQFVYDVTERLNEQARFKTVQEALRQSQKMEAVGQLTGGIAHDFNNMLAVILSSLRLAERRMARGDFNIQEFLSGAVKGAERAATLVSRLLSFSRQQPLSPQRTDANRLVGGMEDVLRRTIPESITMEFVRAGGLWSIHVDPHGLESTLLNLAVNARDAMPDGGKLTFETANAHLDDPYAAAHADVAAGQYVLVAVTDNGHGMTPEVVGRAFEPFFTTKEVGAGTGLGLSQVYGFIKQSRGHVKIYSEVGVGTTIKLYIPRLAEKLVTSPSEIEQTATQVRGKGELVLVVEDDDDVRRLTTEMLSELGFSVLSASNGRDALVLADRHPEIVLLITDVVMPGMNGRKLAEEAQRRRPSLKILFTTGYTRNAIVHNGVLDEGVQLLPKPFSLEAISAKITKLLSER
ncbi:PAS domain-containing protein [Hyphomicrobium sp. LHD-15]|uniref:hybrid sensor histidine kinase/response regulator n=1 Tax=Hyphomicrobium sp. LHD-15 TaxID=3072142 RepID=UPI00280FA39C|nr:PAS domain-containing protein [Hyphomicrobium sp. LHD-15]MDQ8700555.1 PAS domain-containing protein [Hyphomicrobium sp. LHD-15]